MADDVQDAEVVATSELQVKQQTSLTVSLADIETPEDLLKLFKAMQTTFTIVEGSEVHNDFIAAGLGHLIKEK